MLSKMSYRIPLFLSLFWKKASSLIHTLLSTSGAVCGMPSGYIMQSHISHIHSGLGCDSCFGKKTEPFPLKQYNVAVQAVLEKNSPLLFQSFSVYQHDA